MKNDLKPSNVYYYKTGKGPAVVLLHGFPDSGEIWKSVAADLSPEFTVIVPDMPGSVRSPLSGPTLLSEMAVEVKQLLDQEGIKKAVIIGHSMGGYIALAFARAYPRYTAGISLVHSTPFADDEEKKMVRQKAIDIIRNGGKEAFVKQMTANLFAPDFSARYPEVVIHKAAMGNAVGEEGMVNFYKAMIARPDSRDVTAHATFPVQWIFGDQDFVIPYKSIMKECYGASVNFVTLYEGCGHMSMIENKQALINDLAHFANYCHSYPMT
jgi:pimeloyl-ACP methyl ester carboxylesterase